MTKAVHRLILVDRGLEHTHRWGITCSCSWVGVQRRRQHEAVLQHRVHAARQGGTGVKPQPTTPAHLLPETLR